MFYLLTTPNSISPNFHFLDAAGTNAPKDYSKGICSVHLSQGRPEGTTRRLSMRGWWVMKIHPKGFTPKSSPSSSFLRDIHPLRALKHGIASTDLRAGHTLTFHVQNVEPLLFHETLVGTKFDSKIYQLRVQSHTYVWTVRVHPG